MAWSPGLSKFYVGYPGSTKGSQLSEIDPALVVRGRLGEGQEEQKAANEERRIVRNHHGKRHEQELHDGNPTRDRRIGSHFRILGGETARLL